MIGPHRSRSPRQPRSPHNQNYRITFKAGGRTSSFFCEHREAPTTWVVGYQFGHQKNWTNRKTLNNHAAAVDRVRAAVPVVNSAIDAMSDPGGFNAAFKAARKVDPTIRYQDYLHARNAVMLEAIAREAAQ